ncbi:MAG: zinc ribbon domain-containing protein [Hespellia sp.]|nr:zinc ribbon domain-containing protein [Hespellia sp.]
MRDFLEDLGKKLGETADTITSKAGEVVEVQKIKNQIRTLERGNERDLEDIGKMMYEQYRAGEVIPSDMISLCEAIEKRENSITEYNKQLSEVKGTNECPSCGCFVEKGMSFCPFCGTKVAEEKTEDVFEEEPAADAAETTEAVTEPETVAEVVGEAAQNIAEEIKADIDDIAD